MGVPSAPVLMFPVLFLLPPETRAVQPIWYRILTPGWAKMNVSSVFFFSLSFCSSFREPILCFVDRRKQTMHEAYHRLVKSVSHADAWVYMCKLSGASRGFVHLPRVAIIRCSLYFCCRGKNELLGPILVVPLLGVIFIRVCIYFYFWFDILFCVEATDESSQI